MSFNQSDFIEHLFDAISNDAKLPVDLKISLLKLQLSFHKLSSSDPEFTKNAQHPARQTILIVKNLAALTKNNPDTVIEINTILSRLFFTQADKNSFHDINKQLKKIPIVSNRKQQLKEVLSHKIKQCIQGYSIPSPCQNLILKLWPKALFNILNEYGEKSSQWCHILNIFSELLESIQSIDNGKQHNQLKNNFMKIVRCNNNILLQHNKESSVEDAIKSLIKHFNQSILNFEISNKYDPQQQKIIKDNIALLPNTIKPGIWCEIYIDENTPNRRLRLSLINTHTGALLFVNRKGIKKLEKDAAEFSQELKTGLSKIYQHDALFNKTPTRLRQLKTS